MKKILVTTAICLIGAASMMAQGRINFANVGSISPLRISGAEDGSGSVILGTASTAQFTIGPASVQVRLFAGLTSTSLAPVLIGTAANQEFVLNTASGIASVQGTFPGGNPLPLAGFDGSAPVYLQYTATSINGNYAGASSIILVNLGTGAGPSTTVFSAVGTASTWGSLTLTPTTIVPEPSSMALAGLGAASLLIFRRRK
jgi:hypothetical protein